GGHDVREDLERQEGCGLEILRGGDVHAEIEEALRHVVGAGRLELVLSGREPVRGNVVAGGELRHEHRELRRRHAGQQIVERRLVARNDVFARHLGLGDSRRRRQHRLGERRVAGEASYGEMEAGLRIADADEPVVLDHADEPSEALRVEPELVRRSADRVQPVVAGAEHHLGFAPYLPAIHVASFALPLPRMTLYSPRIDDALQFTADAFRTIARKGSEVPYLTHLLQVMVTVGEHGGDEDQLIAALLHDYLEDVPGADAGLVRTRFGDRVL